MTTTVVAPIALAQDEGEALWFLGTRATIKASADTTDGRVCIIEQLAPTGSGSPLHVHANEDEWFYVMEGELTFLVGGERIAAGPGGFVYGPRGIPHIFQVTSEAPAHFLLVAEPGGFEAMVRAAGVPAAAPGLPPADSPPPDMEKLGAAAAAQGIEILGPPGIPQA
jgi:mannose-6-phosphate isomerase-like protein (cupin superfamily)